MNTGRRAKLCASALQPEAVAAVQVVTQNNAELSEGALAALVAYNNLNQVAANSSSLTDETLASLASF